MTEIDVTPDASDFWRTQGHHFDTFTQAVNEFIDNSIANFAANPSLFQKGVTISLRPNEDEGHVDVVVEDTGTGIEDFGVALRFADTSSQDGEPSEHGVGLKHALAYLAPSNDAWWVGTRTEKEVAAGTWRRVSAPYHFTQMSIETIDVTDLPWPGMSNGSGSAVGFRCRMDTFSTVTRGTRGRVTKFSKMVDYLVEDLGYTYAGLLTGGFSIQVLAGGNPRPVLAITPAAKEAVKPGSGEVAAPWNPSLKLRYEFMRTDGRKDTIRRYKATMSTSGVQLRLNGRVIEDNVFGDIWEMEKHNSYNGFLGIVDVISDGSGERPKTLSTKNGFQRDDDQTIALLNWIRNVLPEPPRETYRSTDENELRNLLQESLQSSAVDPTARATREVEVYTAVTDAPPRVDLVYYDGHSRILIECKIGSPKLLDLYQLLMEWDGDVADGNTPNQAWLIADDFPEGIRKTVSVLNQRRDENGQNYDIRCRQWTEWPISRTRA